MTGLVLAIVWGYLLGSVPFGLILTRLGGYGDIRAIGSGNIGATNVLRTGNKKLALATLLLDGAKGAAAVGIALYCATFEIALAAGLAAMVGHLFPVWLGFRGGKGVATALGTLLALKFIVGVAACGLWLLAAAVTRYSSLSALVALGATPVIAHLLYGDANFTGTCAVIAALVFVRHRANIRRLVKGEEPRIGEKK